jgi:hypothetical protein
VLFVARLAFDNLADVGAVAPLLRRSVDLLLESVLIALGGEHDSNESLRLAASALEQAGFWSPALTTDLERVLALSQSPPESAVASGAERARTAEAVSAARRLALAVRRFHESRRPGWVRRQRRLLLAAVIALATALIGLAVHRVATPVEGLAGVYYADEKFQRVALRRVDPEINFEWLHAAPARELDEDAFSVEWSGTLLVPHTEEYVIYLTSDDGSRLYLDGKLVLDHWGVHAADGSRQSAVTLTEGRLPLRLRYFEHDGRAIVRLEWSSKHIPRAPIARRYLRPEP